MTAAKIQIAGLGKTYRSREGEVVALEGVDLAVDTGEFVSCHEEYLYSICTACCREAPGR